MDNVALSDKTKAWLSRLMAQAEKASIELQTYLKGIVDAKELDGQWKLDVEKMELVKVAEETTEAE